MSLLTPSGAGAISVFAISGPDAYTVLTRVLDRPPPAVGRFARRSLCGSAGIIDDVIVATCAPDRLELSGHAGPAIVAATVDTIAAAGARIVASEPEAHPIACARTLLAARVLSWQARGGLHPSPACDRLLARLSRPSRVVLQGPPNAGKSTLFNMLLERPRALTSPIRGTTRDVLREETACAGVPVELADTAGLDADVDLASLEATGAERGRRAARAAELVLIVIDGSVAIDAASRAVLETRPESSIVVLTKADVAHAFAPASDGVPADALRISAVSGFGVEETRLAIATRLLGLDPRTLTSPDAIGDALA